METNERNHDHVHGHEHHGEHQPEINISRHEKALVCSAQIKLNLPYGELIAAVRGALGALAAAAEADGGMVGHIKSSVIHEDKASIFSAAGDDINLTEIKLDRCALSVAAIVFPADEDNFIKTFKKTVKNFTK
jgi:hypothetical protein